MRLLQWVMDGQYFCGTQIDDAWVLVMQLQEDDVWRPTWWPLPFINDQSECVRTVIYVQGDRHG